MDLMSVVTLVLVLALIGFMTYLVVTYIPMPDPFKQMIVVVCVVLLVLCVLAIVVGRVELPRLR